MRRRYKILMGCGIAAGVLILAAGIILFVISRDEAPPYDSDLIVKRLDIPDDQNGFTYFQQAAEVLYWPDTDAWKKSGKHPVPEDLSSAPEDDPQVKAEKEVRDRLDKMLDGKDWDDALAAEVLDANKETFALFEKGLACREFQVPEVKGLDDLTPEKLDTQFDFFKFVRIMTLRANDLARRGQDEAALAQAGDVVQFGHRIECAKGCLINYLIGQPIKGMGLEQLRRFVIECKVPAETLQMTAARLADWGDGGTGLADTLRCEYQIDINTVDRIYRGDMDDKGLITLVYGSLGPSWSERLKVVLFLRPNQTKRMFAETFRSLVEDSTRPYIAARFRPVAPDAPDSLFQMLTSKNSFGRMLHQMVIPTISGAPPIKCRTQTDVAATRAIVALKAFKMKTGRLPKTLDELVPECLAAAPLDDFDGKPLRYSPEKKILYSVGKYLWDVGGFSKEETLKWWQKENPGRSPEDAYLEPPVWNLPNPSWPIEF